MFFQPKLGQRSQETARGFSQMNAPNFGHNDSIMSQVGNGNNRASTFLEQRSSSIAHVSKANDFEEDTIAGEERKEQMVSILNQGDNMERRGSRAQQLRFQDDDNDELDQPQNSFMTYKN